MKTNRLSEKLSTALNEQMTKEAHAFKSTYRMPRGLITMDLLVSQIFFSPCSRGGVTTMKILEYILNRGAKAKVSAIPAPATDPVSVNNCFEKYLSTK
jgi:ferritin